MRPCTSPCMRSRMVSEVHGRLIVVVEDDPAVLNSLEFTLGAEGYQVRGFAQAADALASTAPGHAEGLVIDYGLPDMDGLSLLSALRARAVKAPAVLIASTPSLRCRRDAEAAGVPLIEKPLLAEILSRRLGELLTGPPGV